MLGDVPIYFDPPSPGPASYAFNPKRKREALRLFRAIARGQSFRKPKSAAVSYQEKKFHGKKR
jgi:hypothetical protein